MHQWSKEEIHARLYGGYYEGESMTDTSGYNAMIDDMKKRLDYQNAIEDGYNPFEDVANHGADTGWGGFTYTSECVEFFDAHEDTIMELAREEAEEFGYDNVMQFVGSFKRADMADDMDGYKNLMAWYALETVARREVDA